jgi:hypothetical protein
MRYCSDPLPLLPSTIQAWLLMIVIDSFCSIYFLNAKTSIMSAEKEMMFPAGNTFEINSNPIFLITRKGEREILVFDANMRVQTSNPAKTEAGNRHVKVDVKHWEAKAKSKLLGCDIGFRITDLGDNSKVTAKQLNKDFPSKLEFNMEYEVMIDGEIVKSGLSGSAEGEINSFPPKPNDMFRVAGKSMKLGEDTTIDVVACAC